MLPLSREFKRESRARSKRFFVTTREFASRDEAGLAAMFSFPLCVAPRAASRRAVVSDNVAEDRHSIQASDLVKSQISVVERDFVQGCTRIVAKCFARTLSQDFVNA